MEKAEPTNSVIKIMVVDDEKDILAIIKRGLESDDEFQVDIFTNGEDALRFFQKNQKYSLVITDIRMPKMNGFEFARKIKEADPSVKLAFITAFEINKQEFSKVIPSVDVEDFISKPVSISSLKSKIKKILKT